MSRYHRVVVKLGTSVLTAGTRKLRLPQMVELVRQLSELHHGGHEIIVCTSGAIAAGRERLNFPVLPPTVASKQLLAAVGQSRLMLMWERLFEIYEIHVGQILLTRGDVESRQRFLNAQDTIHALLDHKIIPIINENDAVATEEIKVGDNDNLSALVTILANADLLILLTDQPGLFTADPREHPEATLIPEIQTIDDHVRSLAGASRSGLGVGGMTTKIEAATMARRAGADVVIAAGSTPNILTRIVTGEGLGTRFPALETRLENRKRWILAGGVHSARVVVDPGAAAALRHRGRSLLPAGIVAVEGDFERGDTISVWEVHNGELARGIVRYPSGDLDRIKGCHSDQIADRLGYAYSPVVVHRNDLILV